LSRKKKEKSKEGEIVQVMQRYTREKGQILNNVSKISRSSGRPLRANKRGLPSVLFSELVKGVSRETHQKSKKLPQCGFCYPCVREEEGKKW